MQDCQDYRPIGFAAEQIQIHFEKIAAEFRTSISVWETCIFRISEQAYTHGETQEHDHFDALPRTCISVYVLRGEHARALLTY